VARISFVNFCIPVHVFPSFFFPLEVAHFLIARGGQAVPPTNTFFAIQKVMAVVRDGDIKSSLTRHLFQGKKKGKKEAHQTDSTGRPVLVVSPVKWYEKNKTPPLSLTHRRLS
jgi:hypothetical protein